MYSNHIKSLLSEKLWLFQLKYFPFYSEWMVLLLPLFLFISLPFLLLKMIISLFENRNLPMSILILLFLILSMGMVLYGYIILGEPNSKQWKREIFPKHISQIVTKVYDSTDKMIGGMYNTKLEPTNKGTFYVESVPELYWNILKFREDENLNFNNDKTGIMGILDNPRSFNGVDVMGVPNAILHGRGGSSLSQQLVKNFYGQDYFQSQTNFKTLNTVLRKVQELNEAKTFYHYLKANEGEEFKRWIAMYPPSLVSNGSVYGIESVSAVVFGKKPKDLTELEQVLLSEMHKYTYYFSGEINEEKCQLIKTGAILDVTQYFHGKSKKIKQLNQAIENWTCPKEPRVPYAFYYDMKQQDKRGKAVIGNPNNRIWEWASTSASILRGELDDYRKEHNDSLVIEAKMTIDVPKNIKFKDSINSALEEVEKNLGSRLYVNLNGDKFDERPQANIWISVVNEQGEIVYVYKRGDTHNLRRIGSVSKIFEAIALGNRGDKYNTFYCNEPFKGLHNSDGSLGGVCQDNSNQNIYDARKVFGASKNLPMKSALEKYVIKNNQGIKVIKKHIETEKLAKIYHAFNLQRDNNISMQYELSFGMANSTPLALQKSIHKLTHLLYGSSQYQEAHILKTLKYKHIENTQIKEGGVINSLYQKGIPRETRVMFDRDTKVYMQTVLKAALNPNYGTLKSFNSIPNFTNMFMKSGTTDKPVEGEKLTQSKWVAGAIKVKGKPYSFIIMVHKEEGIGYHITHSELSKVIFREIVQALNLRGE